MHDYHHMVGTFVLIKIGDKFGFDSLKIVQNVHEVA